MGVSVQWTILVLRGHEPPSLPEMRVQHFRNGAWCSKCLQVSTKAAKGIFWSSVLLPNEFNVNFLYRSAAKVQGLIYDQVVVRYRGYPYRLCDLVGLPSEDRHLAFAEFLSAPECMLDEYSRGVRQRYPSAVALASRDCQTELHIVLQRLDCTTYDTERLHARNLRRVSRRQQQTNRLSLSELGLIHVGVSAPRKMKACKLGALGWSGADQSFPRDSDAKISGHRGGRRKKRPRTKTQRRSGGPWRAFLHCDAQERQAHSNQVQWREAAHRYHGLDEETKSKYVALGRMATWRRRHGFSTFPMTHIAAQNAARRGAEGSEMDGSSALNLPLHPPGQHSLS